MGAGTFLSSLLLSGYLPLSVPMPLYYGVCSCSSSSVKLVLPIGPSGIQGIRSFLPQWSYVMARPNPQPGDGGQRVEALGQQEQEKKKNPRVNETKWSTKAKSGFELFKLSSACSDTRELQTGLVSPHHHTMHGSCCHSLRDHT